MCALIEQLYGSMTCYTYRTVSEMRRSTTLAIRMAVTVVAILVTMASESGSAILAADRQ